MQLQSDAKGETGQEAQMPWTDAAQQVAEALDADVYLFNGEIARPYDRQLIDELRAQPRRTNILFLLVTNGGNPDAAYRMARCLQRSYKRVIVFVPGFCKSAGTLLVIGGHEFVMSDQGELGPLDVQMQKTDELFEMSSGLTVMEAIRVLEERASLMLEGIFIRIKAGSGGQITFRTASDIAVKMVTGLLDPIFEQIDPMHVGEAGRAMKVGRDYGERLQRVSGNLKEDALNELVALYGSHGFVIDREEAGRYFTNIRASSNEEEALADVLGDAARWPAGAERPLMGFLSSPTKITGDGEDRTDAEEHKHTEANGGGDGVGAETVARGRGDAQDREPAPASGDNAPAS
jgi:Serine dehydrogenase proteinase